ncbi:LacI family DNA-binding transcriptional regulator [Amycolatopsis sp. NPDC098790]|uniref:LacI family DNA-binding transcriptional regulator n=1 Tax=Amycolatopsis sp. NPDC098790 TaxID=3363939 RepID=UPI0037FF05AF
MTSEAHGKRPDTYNAAQRGRPTMADVAAHVGVSKALVSIVFRGAPGASAETRQKVLDGAAELGYRPDGFAQGLRRHRSKQLGVLFTVRAPFESELVERIYPAAQALGYRVVLGAMTSGRTEDAAIEELISYRCEALILIAPQADIQRLDVLAGQLPIVELGRRVTTTGVDVVRSDDADGVTQAVEHLVELGHRAIVHVDGGTNPGAAERRQGYHDAMDRHGLAEEIRVLPGDYSEESGAQAAAELLRGDRLPTAIVAGNDQSALGLLDTLLRAGIRIPDDISLVGYDDTRFARLPFVNLTSVRQDAEQMAELAVKAAVARLESTLVDAKEVALTPTLVVRGTTGPPPTTARHPPRPSATTAPSIPSFSVPVPTTTPEEQSR